MTKNTTKKSKLKIGLYTVYGSLSGFGSTVLFGMLLGSILTSSLERNFEQGEI